MTRTTSLLAWLDDLRGATAFLTPLVPENRQWNLTRSLRAFPLVGLAIGACGALIYALSDWIGLPPWPAAFLALGALLLVTGARHERGLAAAAESVSDETASESGKAAGIPSILSLVLLLGVKAAAISALEDWDSVAAVLIAVHAASRGILPLALHLGAPVESGGLAQPLGRPTGGVTLTALALAALALLLLLGIGTLLVSAVLLVALILATLRLVADRSGGYTANWLGALQQLAEVLLLLIAVVICT